MARSFWVWLATALLVVSCGQERGMTYTPPALEEEWAVKFTLSGGFEGVMRSLEVSADGSYTVSDERDGSSTEGKLSQEEMQTLEGLINGLTFSAPTKPSNCADCFVYTVEIAGSGKKMIASADDVTLNDSGMAALVEFLQTVMDSARQ